MYDDCILFIQVKENQDRAHKKQQEVYAKRKAKGVKTFSLQVGDLVLRRNMKNVGRKGGAMESYWTGPYRLWQRKYNRLKSGKIKKVPI